jgi:asparagine synthetase B (glutamine-hydrolysing)
LSGFALMFDQEKPLTAQEPLFAEFLESVTSYKCLDKPEQFAIGTQCIATKLDSDATLHRGIFLDKATGSWLLAVGTLIDNADVQPDGNLQQLLTDYLDQGMKVFERLDGHFALVIYNQREDSLAVVSDPFGFISIFYGQKGSRFFISTSSLATAKAVQSKPSEFGARHFISYGGLLGEMTLWEQVNRLPPATALKVTRNEIKKFTYWSFEINQTVANLSQDESIDCVVEVLSRTLRRGLSREGKVWLSLTGGLDTRALATMVHYSGLPFKAYFHGQPDSRDVRIASLIVQKMGWESEYFDLPEDWG